MERAITSSAIGAASNAKATPHRSLMSLRCAKFNVQAGQVGSNLALRDAAPQALNWSLVRMAIVVAKLELKTVMDASGMEVCIKTGMFGADEVIAVIGKTEGNGGVNDFTRILADQAFRSVLTRLGHRGEADIAKIPMVWSGGCDGVITPHATVFARNAETGPASKSRVAIGTAMSAELLPEDIGRPAMVEKVAEGVKAAMRDAGISDVADVHYVQTKTPLLTIDSVRDAESRGHDVACEVHDSMGVSNGTTALGIAVALGEIKMPRAEQICKDLDLYSSVASCSSGVELTQAQIVLIGNKAGAGGCYRIGHAVMKDALDLDGIYAAIRNAGLDLPDRPRAEDLGGRVVNCFMKCEADRRGTLRGRRQIMLDDSDVHHHRHAKAAVGGVAAAAIGDPAVFVSVDAMHQGPHGGGPVIAIIDAGE
jgi:ring-opening amidohydrolase-like protein